LLASETIARRRNAKSPLDGAGFFMSTEIV